MNAAEVLDNNHLMIIQAVDHLPELEWDIPVAVFGNLSKCCFSWNNKLWYNVNVNSMTSDVAVSPVWNLGPPTAIGI
jgi:hypothetical protein